MTIDYDKLKLAHELAEKSGSYICYAYENKNGNFVNWVDLDQLILELKELTQPQPKYEDGQEVWVMYLPIYTNSMQPGKFKTDAHKYEDGVHKYCLIGNGVGLTWREENNIYPSREALIKGQIEYWTCLKNEEKSTRDDHRVEEIEKCVHDEYIAVSGKPMCRRCGIVLYQDCEHEGEESKCEYESINYEIVLKPSQCHKCESAMADYIGLLEDGRQVWPCTNKKCGMKMIRSEYGSAWIELKCEHENDGNFYVETISGGYRIEDHPLYRDAKFRKCKKCGEFYR